MAGQLRFSTAPSALTELPFGTTVKLVDDPEAIVRAFLDSSFRDGLPWADLKQTAAASLDTAANDNDVEQRELFVWAVELSP